jgi:hypothetical protein
MENILDKPQISEKSQKLIMESGRYRLPMHSPDRYQMEIENYRLKKESY